jgi:hypothetical protein
VLKDTGWDKGMTKDHRVPGRSFLAVLLICFPGLVKAELQEHDGYQAYFGGNMQEYQARRGIGA